MLIVFFVQRGSRAFYSRHGVVSRNDAVDELRRALSFQLSRRCDDAWLNGEKSVSGTSYRPLVRGRRPPTHHREADAVFIGEIVVVTGGAVQ